MKTQRVVQGSTKDGVGVVINASHGCPRISESQNNQNQLSLPPIILVSYKHEISAKHV
jgi:hypothetical protein